MKLADMLLLCHSATPAPWSADDLAWPLTDTQGNAIVGSCCCAGFVRPQDADFVVNARSIFPKLLEFVGQAEHAAQQLECCCDWNPETQQREHCCERCWILEAKYALEKDE